MATPLQEDQFERLQQAGLQGDGQHRRVLAVWLQLAGVGGQGLAFARQAGVVELYPMGLGPGQARVIGRRPMPRPHRRLGQLHPAGLSRLGSGAAGRFVVAVAVTAPGSQQ
ncbi:hypothetical protein WR25_20733 [Diploscapter pachys]|uniref:Uncharacterized protein n=1 Tax=Diploscapter pachys TaxID=2018661 RepID=A0A2A2M5Q4_9BILA|nr:hypothetical protein WR25_20733 [Diploscapter pachys]